MDEQSEQELLDLLAERAGIAAEYFDIAGTRHVTLADTKQAILKAMGFQTETREALLGELRAWEESPWKAPCDPVLIVREDEQDSRWLFRLPCEEGREQDIRIVWEIQGEQGEVVAHGEAGPGLEVHGAAVVDNLRYVRLSVPLQQGLPCGYYDLRAGSLGTTPAVSGTLHVIIAPRQCYVPQALLDGQRTWGLSLQLYSVRSTRNWGIGDFHDLADLTEWAGKELGAGVIGLNPLHALKNTHPYTISPYSPNSRLYMNEVYLDLESVPEFKTSADAQRLYRDREFQTTLEHLRKSEHVDYDAVSALKRSILEPMYKQFLRQNYGGDEPSPRPRSARGWVFERYVREEGEALEQFALYQALDEERRLVQSASTVWQQWPEPYRSPRSAASREFARRHSKRVRMFQYIQWLAATQMKALVDRTRSVGMSVGLYHDLALGSDRCGADAWIFQDILAMGADCGAPPDAFAPAGQNWGFSPMHPLRLRAVAYRPFAQLVRKNLQQGGAIRLDHVMALFRLFWIPRDRPASAGTYVHYPAEDLLAILALESMRARTLVIGEDLGTVPDWIRERLAQARVLSYRVFYFERQGDGAWKPPSWYPAASLAVATTHDLPTLAGYWTGEDIRVRTSLGLVSDTEALSRAWQERQEEKGRILHALKAEGLLPAGVTDDPASAPTMSPDLCRAVYAYLGRTPSWVMLVSLDDLIGETAQTNVPGTVDQHPNWSRKLALNLEDLRLDERGPLLAALLRHTRSVV